MEKRQRRSYKGRLYGCNKLRTVGKCDAAPNCRWCRGAKLHGRYGACLQPSQYKKRCVGHRSDFKYLISPKTGRQARIQVWNGTAVKTRGGLTADDLMINKRGRLVSKRASKAAKKRYLRDKDYLESKGFVKKTIDEMAELRAKRNTQQM